ncbi:DNA helicase related protein [Blastochloris viridis]|uniref:DNA helicase related protein n=1 Tax=Blastochloris viridis TaxID=1079 RepID=A0A0H5BQG6_BLAVI|nr:DNA helicase related protein [Blastochloris viridis]CUU41883.1 putative DNA helicase [Blastochloris viridis]
MSDVEVAIASEPAFAKPLTIRIDAIAAGTTHHLRTPDLALDAGFLRNVTETIRGSVTITATSGGATLAGQTFPIELLPPSHWGGSAAAPELLAAFVRPNDPAVDVVLHDAAARLAVAGRGNEIAGYAAGSRQRAWEAAGAIWSALAGRSIAYVLPPASFEQTGQKVRSPSDILERCLATCLDSALLFAACLEQAHLNPLVVLTKGHAFVGLWLKDDGFSAAVVDDGQVLRKRRDLDDLIFIETTLLTQTPPARFRQAVEHAAKLLDDGAPSALEFALDVKRARTRGIRPLDLAEPASPPAPTERPPVDIGLDDAPSFAEDVVVREAADARLDRLERWKRKLLDLSLRNRLLNFKDGKTAVALDCTVPARLEDLLSAGKRFKLLPKSDVLGDTDPRDPTLFIAQRQDDARRNVVLEALEQRNELHTFLTPADLDARLTELFRVTRTAFEDGGSNILFLAVGFLSWRPQDRAKTGAKSDGKLCRAPLVLIPVALQRASVRSGFRLAAHEEEARFNPTLLEMLRQDYRLSLPELEGELPGDESGLDIARILQIVRTHIRDLDGWEVAPDVVLATFSFTKFLMWKDLVERTDLLKRNPVVKHLIDTPQHAYGDDVAFPTPDAIDGTLHPSDLFAPLPADSSQLSAVVAAASGKDFVLFGPPGTGKSQTIANMISQCLALGRSVLFVSQKTAALEVVQRRLRDIGLGEYCLEVHSAKAQKSAVLGQLKMAWHERSAPSTEGWHVATAVLARLRDELNALVQALHRRRPSGMTAHEAFGRVVAARGRFEAVRFDFGDAEHTPDQLARLRELIGDIRIALADVGEPAHHALRGIAVTDWSPRWRAEFEQAIDAFVAAARALGGRAEAFGASIGLTVADSPSATSALRALGQLLLHPAADDGVKVLGVGVDKVRQALAELEALQARAGKLAGGLSAPYRASVYREDLRALLSDWIAATTANFVVRGARQKRVRQALQPFATARLGGDIGADLAILIDIKDFARAADALGDRLGDVGTTFAGLDTDAATVRVWLEWTDYARQLAAKLEALSGVEADQILHHVILLQTEFRHLFEPGGEARTAAEALNAALDAMVAAHKAMTALAGGGERPPAFTAGPSWLDDAIAGAERWKSHLAQAQSWCHWNAALAGARAAGLAPLVDAIARGAIGAAEADAAFEAAYARWQADRIMTEDHLLRGFTAVRHADTIARFRAADEQVAELTRRVVRSRLVGEVPSPTAFGADPEWGALARELAKRARHRPLRQLFARIPNVLTRLTPCVMMSPLSIAQYLPPDLAPFDVVIFDEASQIPVWDAIGAIARGRQVVIVGDPEQLPPTSVGERGAANDDDADIEDQESILDECLASNIPQLRLDWHYRSRHESLIAFSNAHYYAGRLVTFPSPLTRDTAVRYVHVPGGVYERGAGRVNRVEADAVVGDIVRRLADPEFTLQRSSLGVVTFNAEQQRLIENLLDEARRGRPELEPFFDPARWHEPVFVKNLETVQGDERDVILFSVAVAPDDSGRPVATISSLNRDGGHRRLNVAITRARRELAVFATLRAEQIDLSRTDSRGVRDFKHFLEFAERGTGAIAEAFAAGRSSASPFEAAVKAALERRGWSVRAEVGVSAFRVDLAVVDPDAPHRYLAGVECDGATYHRAATARDRDRLREQVLTGLGWRIHRVWSTDWWLDADRALDKLHDQLMADLDASRAAAKPEPAAAGEGADQETGQDSERESGLETGREVTAEPAADGAATQDKALQVAAEAAILEAAIGLAAAAIPAEAAEIAEAAPAALGDDTPAAASEPAPHDESGRDTDDSPADPAQDEPAQDSLAEDSLAEVAPARPPATQEPATDAVAGQEIAGQEIAASKIAGQDGADHDPTDPENAAAAGAAGHIQEIAAQEVAAQQAAVDETAPDDAISAAASEPADSPPGPIGDAEPDHVDVAADSPAPPAETAPDGRAS